MLQRALVLTSGQTFSSAQGRIEGYADANLTPYGRVQSEALAATVVAHLEVVHGDGEGGPLPPVLVLTSDLNRARYLADTLCQALVAKGCQTVTQQADYRLRDAQHGQEGMDAQDLSTAQAPKPLEPLAAVRDRAWAAFHYAMAVCQGRYQVVLVTHRLTAWAMSHLPGQCLPMLAGGSMSVWDASGDVPSILTWGSLPPLPTSRQCFGAVLDADERKVVMRREVSLDHVGMRYVTPGLAVEVTDTGSDDARSAEWEVAPVRRQEDVVRGSSVYDLATHVTALAQTDLLERIVVRGSSAFVLVATVAWITGRPGSTSWTPLRCMLLLAAMCEGFSYRRASAALKTSRATKAAATSATLVESLPA
jgi:broad specificity phosphatase PhoE